MQELQILLFLVIQACTAAGRPFSVLIPPEGVLSIYSRSTGDFESFESAIFPVYVTSHQPAVLSTTTTTSNSRTPSHVHGRNRKIQGRLMAAYSPSDGCELDKMPSIPQIVDEAPEDWVLLVDNLNCNASVKMRNAAAMDYAALLIYNEKNSEYEPEIIRIDPIEVNSATVYTSSVAGVDGRVLRSQYAWPNQYTIELEEQSFVFIDVLYHLMLICFTITSVFVGLLCATWVYDACACQRCIERLEEDRKRRLLQAFLSRKTITRQWTADGPFQNNDSCIICLEEFSVADQIRVLPCLHVFHITCIDHWMLRQSMCCPICKQWIGTKVEEQQILRASDHEYYGTHTEGNASESHPGESIPLLPMGIGSASVPSSSGSAPQGSVAASYQYDSIRPVDPQQQAER